MTEQEQLVLGKKEFESMQRLHSPCEISENVARIRLAECWTSSHDESAFVVRLIDEAGNTLWRVSYPDEWHSGQELSAGARAKALAVYLQNRCHCPLEESYLD